MVLDARSLRSKGHMPSEGTREGLLRQTLAVAGSLPISHGSLLVCLFAAKFPL